MQALVKPKPTFAPADRRSYEPTLLELADGPLSAAELQSFTNRFEFQFPPVPNQKLDFLSVTGSLRLISGRVRDLIEALEPGAHQFIGWEPVASPKILKILNDRQFYYIHCYRRIDFIDIEHSWVIQSKFSSHYELSMNGEDKLVAKSGWRPTGHLWRSVRSVLSGDLFVSQELKDALTEMEAGPIHYWPVKTI